MSAFSTYQELSKSVDLLKFILSLYTLYCVLVNYQSYSIAKIFSFGAIFENFTDIMIIALQFYSFIIKVSDADSFDINPPELLQKRNRMKYIERKGSI